MVNYEFGAGLWMFQQFVDRYATSDPSQVDDPERDRFILSKGRSAVALSSRRKALCESWQKAVARAILDSTKPASNVTSF